MANKSAEAFQCRKGLIVTDSAGTTGHPSVPQKRKLNPNITSHTKINSE
jgi:hypothetical protein